MAGEQAFYSMDEKKQEQGPRQCDEMWSELSNPRGREFDLPNLTYSTSANESDNNVDSAPFQMLGVPLEMHDTFLQADPSFGGNLSDPCYILENPALSVLNTCLTDGQNGLSKEYNRLDIPVVDGLSLNFDIDDFMKKHKLNVVESSDLPTLSSITSPPPEANLTNGHFSFDGRTFGPGILKPVQNQSRDILVAQNVAWSGPNDFTINNNAYFSSRNEGAHFPNTNTGYSIGTLAHNYDGPVQINNPAYATGMPMIMPTPMYDEQAAQTYPQSNFFGPGENGQPFGLDPFQVGHTSSSYVSGDNGALNYAGNDDEGKFTGYGAFGGPVGFHENPMPTYFNSGTTAANAFPTRQLELGHPWVALEDKTAENYFSNKGKGKMTMPFDGDMVKQEWGQSCKRFRAGTSGAAENRASQFVGPIGEASSPTIVHNVLMQALNALKDIPSQGTVRPRQLVFKEPSNSKNSEK